MSRIVKAYITVVVAMALPVIWWAAAQWAPKEWYKLISFLAVGIVTAGVKVTLPGINGTMSAGFFVGLIALVELPAPEFMLVGFTSTLTQTYWNPRFSPPWYRTAFNLSAIMIASYAAHRVLHGMLPAAGLETMAPRIMISATVYFFANTVLVAMAIGLTENKSLPVVVRDYCVWGFPFYVVGAGIAGLANAMTKVFSWETTFMTFPVIIVLHRSYKFYLGRLEAEKKHVTDMAALHLRTIEALALAIDAKDNTTHEHLRRVQGFSVEIAKEIGLEQNLIEAIHAAALLHDIGKLAVPEHIVGKPGHLTQQEFEKVKIHTVVGAEILEQVEFPYPVVPIVRSHHERWDGKGYPDRLKGEEIPIGARILSAVDCLDAIASDRPYRKALPLDEAMAQVEALSGKAFDPAVVDILKRRYRDLEESTKKTAVTKLRKVSRGLSIRHGEAPARLEPAAPQESGSFVTTIAAARQEAQFLFEVTNDLGSSLSLSETLSVVGSRLEKLVPHDSIAIFINRNNVLKPEYVRGEDFRLLTSLEIPWGEGLSGWAAATKDPILNGNPSVEPSYLNDPSAFSLLRSALAVPLIDDGDQVVGVLTLYGLQKDAFSADHERVLVQINNKLAKAIQNSLRFQQAESSATIDALTGLPNARALFAHLDNELARAKGSESSVAVLVCDLDGFKAVNDRWGHLEGNRVLQLVAKGFKAALRERDYVARMGGDEFVFVLPGVHLEDAEKMIPRLEKVARQAGRDVTNSDVLSVSVGSSAYLVHGLDAEELLSVADKRMYKNKAENKQKYGTPGRGDLAITLPQQSAMIH
ncbi:MAG: diguanylate cyclase [Acidobacteria bacterium]|nr:diguanylate cyclase [Acidobacteriota bacterium]